MKLQSLFVLCLVALAPTAYAQTAADHLAASPRHQEWIYVDAGDGDKVSAFVVHPESADPTDSVVVIHDIMGMSDWARHVGDELAKAGYLAIVPDFLSGKAPNGGNSEDFEKPAERGRAMRELTAEELYGRIGACVEYARALPSTTDAVSVGGFCWGGGITFRYAIEDQSIRAAYVFYGSPPGDVKGLQQIEAPVIGFYGEFDNRINSTLETTQLKMDQYGKTFEPVIYPGVGHGFVRNGMGETANDVYKEQTAAAWARWLEHLGRD